MLGVGKAAPAQFILRGKTNLRRISAAGQKAGFTAYPSHWPSIWWDAIGRQRIFSPTQDSGWAIWNLAQRLFGLSPCFVHFSLLTFRLKVLIL